VFNVAQLGSFDIKLGADGDLIANALSTLRIAAVPRDNAFHLLSGVRTLLSAPRAWLVLPVITSQPISFSGC